MKKYFKRMKIEKGQGLTEYVLILAFIAGVAFMMFGGSGSLKGTVVGTFTETHKILAGLFSEERTYASALKDWGKMSRDKITDISNDDRVKMDQEALANIGGFFLGLKESEVSLYLINSTPVNSTLFHYKENYMGDVGSNMEFGRIDQLNQAGKPLGDEIAKSSADVYRWMQGNYTGNGEEEGTYSNNNTKFNATSRYFFSDYARANSTRGVKITLDYGTNSSGETVVTAATVAIDQGSIKNGSGDSRLAMTVTSDGRKYNTPVSELR